MKTAKWSLIVLAVKMLFGVVAYGAPGDVPKYKVVDMVGAAQTMDKELDQRIKGIISSNRYEIRDTSNRVVDSDKQEELKADHDGSYVFTVSTPGKPGLSLLVSAFKKDGALYLRFKDATDKKKNELATVDLPLPWKKPDQKGATEVISSINKFGNEFDQNADFQIKDAYGYGPPSHRQMALLAVFLMLKKHEVQKGKEEKAAYYRLLDYLFKDIDLAAKG